MSHHRPCSSPTNCEDHFTVLTSQSRPYVPHSAPASPSAIVVPFANDTPPLQLSEQSRSRSTKREKEESHGYTHSRLLRIRRQIAPTTASTRQPSNPLGWTQEANFSTLGSSERQDVRLASSSAQQRPVLNALSHHTSAVFVLSNAQASTSGFPGSFPPVKPAPSFTPFAYRDFSRLTTSSDTFPIVLRRNTLLVRSVAPSTSMDTSTLASDNYPSASDTFASIDISSPVESSPTSDSATQETTSTFSTSIPPPFESTSTGSPTSDSWDPTPTMDSAPVTSLSSSSILDTTAGSSSTLEPSIDPTTENVPTATPTNASQVPESTYSPRSPAESTTFLPDTGLPSSPIPTWSSSSRGNPSRQGESSSSVSGETLAPSITESILTTTPSELPTPVPFPTFGTPSSLPFPQETLSDPAPSPTTPSGGNPVITVVESSETTVTITNTFVSISTHSDLFVTTVTSAAETGVLQTPSLGLSDSIGTIVGATVGGGGSLLLAILAVWFFIRKYQRKRANGDEEAAVQEWRSPLHDEADDKSARFLPFGFSDKIRRKLSTRTVVDDREHSLKNEGLKEMMKAEKEGLRALGSVRDADTEAADIEEGVNMGRVSHTPESSTAHSHEDLSRTLEELRERQADEDLVEIPLYHNGPSHTGLSNPQLYPPMNSTSFIGDSVARVNDSGHASLFFGSVATAATRSSNRHRASLSGPRPQLASQRTTGNFSVSGDGITPSFPVDAPSSHHLDEAKAQEQGQVNNKGILRGWLDRWAGRKPALQDDEAKVGSTSDDFQIPNPFKRSMDSLEGSPIAIPSPVHTPLASVSVAKTPTPLLSFPRGVTGKGYTADASVSGQPVLIQPASISAGHFAIPTPPSPTDSVSVVKVGLLHPRLSMMNECARQSSMASFNDHEDYSRPIGATALDRENSIASSKS